MGLTKIFRKTKLVNDTTKKLVGRLLMDSFNSLDPTDYLTIDDDIQDHINAAIELGLAKEADEMISSAT